MTRFERRRRASAAAALLVVAVILGGCGGDEPSAAEQAPTPMDASVTDTGLQDEARARAEAAPATDDSVDDTPTPTAEPGADGTVTPEPSETATPEPPPIVGGHPAVHLLFEGYPVAPGPYLVSVHRGLAEPGDLMGLLEALAAGPTADEAAAGLSSALPAGTRVIAVEVADGIATIDLTAEFASGGGSLSMLARAAQVVHTATSVTGIDGVLFELEGEPLTVLGGEGLLLEGPQTRAGHAGLLPPILVEQPAWGGPATSDMAIEGTVAEGAGAVSWVLVDADGLIVAEGDAEATAGDSRAVFRAEPGAAAARAVSLIVFSLDADGRQRSVLEYPVVPAG